MKSSIKSIIGKVVPEGIKNTYRKLLLNRYIQREIEPMLTKYDIKVVVKIKGKIYEFGSGSTIFYIDDKDVNKDFYERFVKDGKVISEAQKRYLLPYWLLMEYMWQINGIIINEEYERYYKPKRGDIIIDAGAYMGVFTIKTAKIVGKEGLIIAIEPDSRNTRILKKNLSLNGCNNVTIINKAVWSTCGEIDYKKYAWSAVSAVATLRPDDIVEFGGKQTVVNVVKVPTTTIDDIVSDLGLNRLDLIKMDIEGSEIEAIKGAKNSHGRADKSPFCSLLFTSS